MHVSYSVTIPLSTRAGARNGKQNTRLQLPRTADEEMLRRILHGLSRRDCRAAEVVPEAFGLSRSSVSRRYVRATARKLAALQDRRLDRDDVVALMLDGIQFADSS